MRWTAQSRPSNDPFTYSDTVRLKNHLIPGYPTWVSFYGCALLFIGR